MVIDTCDKLRIRGDLKYLNIFHQMILTSNISVSVFSFLKPHSEFIKIRGQYLGRCYSTVAS